MLKSIFDVSVEGCFTRILPNQYVFKGAEVLSDYGMADDCLQHEGDLFGEGYSTESASSSSVSEDDDAPSTTTNREGSSEKNDSSKDRFIQRLLRQCRTDPELQRYLTSKKVGSCTANGSEEDDCVLVSSKEQSPVESPEVKRRKFDAKKMPEEENTGDAKEDTIATEIVVQHL